VSVIKKIILFFLVLEIAVPAEVPHVFTAVPSFIDHYEHHNREHHEIGFLEFVGEHLTQEEAHHADSEHPEHDHCPISHNHTFVAFQTMLPNDYKVSFLFLHLSAGTEKMLIRHEFSVSSYDGSIWQPPKVA